jgi:putative flippase GtrA
MKSLRELIRNISVGGAVSIGYIGLTAALLELFEWPALSSSIIAFSLMLPLSYSPEIGQ